MKKAIIIVALLLFALSGCGNNVNNENTASSADTAAQLSNEDFIGKRLSTLTGSAFDQKFVDSVGDMIPVHCNSNLEKLELVKNGRADAGMLDEPVARKFLTKYTNMMIIYPSFTYDEYGVAFSKENDALREQFNAFLTEIKASGVYDDLIKRWIDTDSSPPMPDIPLTGKNGKLVFASTGVTEPFSYMVGDKMEGFDAEIAARFAQYMDMDIEYQVMEFGSLIPAVQTGKADFAGCLFTITEARKEFVNFSDPYYIGGGVLVTLNPESDNTVVESQSFWQSLQKSFTQNLIVESRWKTIAEGLRVSIIITLFAFVLATVMGFGVCGLRMSKNPILNAIGSIYITILRGTPIVVLLMITFYVIFAKSSISGTVVAIIAFGANGAAFIGEIVRSAILTVDKGQIEAARSMGFSKVGAFFTVTFPQAVRVAFPVYKSEFISMFKMTSVVGYIAIVDLTKAGDIIRSRTYDAFFPLIVVALLYLAAASIMIFIFDLINRATDKRARRVKK